MLRWEPLSLALVLLVITPRFVPAQESLPELVKRIKPSVVAVVTYNSKGENLARGSGFFVGPDRVVTNRHVIEGAQRAEIHMINGNTYNVKGVLATDGEGDVALLQVEIPPSMAKPLAVVRTSPQEGESIVVIGNPLGLEGSVSYGIVSAVRDIPNFGHIIQIQAPISAGSSGSPVVNMQGQVVGVATLQLTEGQSLNFAVPSERVAQLQSGSLRTLGDLVTETSKNKRTMAERFYMQGLGFLSRDERDKALPYFKKAVDADPAYADAWYQIGYCNVMLGRYEEAIKASTQAIKLKPDSAESYINIGYANFYLQKYDEAVKAYRQAIRLDSENADAQYTLGLAYNKLGQTEQEVLAYKQAIRIKPDYTNAYERLGLGYVRLKRYTEAVDAFNKLIQLKPSDAKAYFNLGETYLKMSQAEKGSEAFRQAIRLKPDFARAYFNLGKVYASLGNRDGAIEQYNILRTLNPDLADELSSLISPPP